MYVSYTRTAETVCANRFIALIQSLVGGVMPASSPVPASPERAASRESNNGFSPGGASVLNSNREQRNRYAVRTEKVRIKPKGSDDAGWETTLRFQPDYEGGQKQTLFQNASIDFESGGSVTQQLLEALSENMMRVVELFRSWDENLDGRITKKEFRKSMKVLMKKVDTQTVDSLFDSFDIDHSGAVEFKELVSALRQAEDVVQKRREAGVDVSTDSIAAWMNASKDSVPGMPWRGPLLSRKAVVYVLGPPVQQTNRLCQKVCLRSAIPVTCSP